MAIVPVDIDIELGVKCMLCGKPAIQFCDVCRRGACGTCIEERRQSSDDTTCVCCREIDRLRSGVAKILAGYFIVVSVCLLLLMFLLLYVIDVQIDL